MRKRLRRAPAEVPPQTAQPTIETITEMEASPKVAPPTRHNVFTSAFTDAVEAGDTVRSCVQVWDVRVGCR